ncbi:MAG TPA: enoyl-CoA hydratase-related protein, partial [Vicinamibacterales bacterium]|nr:enoyl-CoA hydratase-related protein [Vicinamibacterales bacterium]
YSIDDVDRVMKWGFGWELGPFELWDAIGAREVLAGLEDASGQPATAAATAPLVAEALASGRNRFRDDGLAPAGADLEILKSAKDQKRVVRQNAGASLIDLGDGVLALEFHSKMNAIGPDTLQMMRAATNEATTNFAALVIGNDAPDFSAGANLMLLLLEAQEGNWDDIDSMIRAFQDSNQALRAAAVPVVSAAAGRTLGGGCEITLHAHRVQAATESYIGLVEVGVGLIPGGGGTKEMLARAVSDLPSPDADLLPFVQRVFETIGFAKVSTSAAEAKELHYLGEADRVTMNRERLMADAKAHALELVDEGPRRLLPRDVTVGGESTLAALKLGVHLAWRAGRISDHDLTVGRSLATVLAGGSLPHRTMVSEQYLLDLEREAFLSLCGQAKTLERIQYTLKTGKALRN